VEEFLESDSEKKGSILAHRIYIDILKVSLGASIYSKMDSSLKDLCEFLLAEFSEYDIYYGNPRDLKGISFQIKI